MREQDSSTDQLYSSDEDEATAHSRRTKSKSEPKPKKERPKLSVEQLRALVRSHKERAVQAREEIEKRRKRREGKGEERERSESEVSGKEERAPSWRKRGSSEDEEEVDQLESSEEEEETGEESEKSRIGALIHEAGDSSALTILWPAGSPFKTPSSIFNKLAIGSSSKKQRKLFSSPSRSQLTFSNLPAFPSSPTKPFASPSKSTSRIIPLPPSSPFQKPSTGSPRKPSKPKPTPSSPALSSLPLPPFLTSGKASTARLLRQRVAWILSTAATIAQDVEKNEGREDSKWWSRRVAKEVLGCSEEWWRVNGGFEREERELGLTELDGFEVFCVGGGRGEEGDPPAARYYSFVHHYKLCGHTTEECPHHRALVLYYSFRVPKGTVGKKSLPRRWDLEDEETRREWNEFGEWWEGMKERMGWGEERSRSRSVSPRKRKLEVKEEEMDDEEEFGD